MRAWGEAVSGSKPGFPLRKKGLRGPKVKVEGVWRCTGRESYTYMDPRYGGGYVWREGEVWRWAVVRVGVGGELEWGSADASGRSVTMREARGRVELELGG